MLLYYITDRKGFGGTDAEQQTALLRRIAEAARAGVDYIQLREKDLSARELERLARAALRAVRDSSKATKLLINGRPDIALACDADGVHLPSNALSAPEVRAFWRKCCNREPVIGVSAHWLADLRDAAAQGADFAVLAPIFEKVQTGAKGIGLDALRAARTAISAIRNRDDLGGNRSANSFGDRQIQAASNRLAILALGGVNLANAGDCRNAGADGVAGIRLFQSGDLKATVRQLREL
jgi:thiamine-phosphate pyrophosphorylase